MRTRQLGHKMTRTSPRNCVYDIILSTVSLSKLCTLGVLFDEAENEEGDGAALRARREAFVEVDPVQSSLRRRISLPHHAQRSPVVHNNY
jgi:hypothetical protein